MAVREQETRNSCVEDSVSYFKDGLYCSEAILKAFNEHYNLGLTPEVLKIATGFGAGLGAAKCCCGSLTGGVMVLSLISGRSTTDESETPAFDAVSKLHDEFKKEFGATCCRALTKPIEWGSSEHHEYCVQFVRRASEITDSYLRENLKFNSEK